jgi:hypothetical protein
MAGHTLMTLPLEVRHGIFKATADRPEGTRKVLRRWFEKKDVKEQIVKLQPIHPDTTFVAVYGDETYFGSMDYLSDTGGDDSDDEDVEEGSDNDDDDGEDDEDDADDEEEEEEDDGDDLDEEEEEDDQDMFEDGNDDDETMEDVDGHKLTTEPVAPHTKWRHIPKFLSISGVPPPKELMMTSKALHEEATDWFYNVANITIDATGSFAHTSMFEEALGQIADAAFSPFEKIRKLTIKFVWDSEWLRGPDAKDNGPVFQALLLGRVVKIIEILRRCPDLHNITLEWHDTIRDADSEAFVFNIYEHFDEVLATLTIEEHYLPVGQKPSRKTDIGKKRREFQAIADGGFQVF